MRVRSISTGALMVALALILSVITPVGTTAQQPLPLPAVGAAPQGQTFISPEVLDAFRAAESGGTRTSPSVRVIVSFVTGKGFRSVGLTAEDVGTAGAQVLAALPAGSYQVVSTFRRIPSMSLEIGRDALDALAQNPLVYAVTLDSVVRTHMKKALGITGVPAVHSLGYTGEGLRVAIIDTGVDNDHPSLADDLILQRCFRTEGDCPAGAQDATDQDGHGTHVAGIITGALGVAPDVEFAALKVFTLGSSSDTNILNALDFVIDNTDTGLNLGFDFVNMSLGASAYPDQASCDANNAPYLEAFTSLNALGVTVFVSTGNEVITDAVGAPGCVSGAVGVGSTGDAEFGAIDFGDCLDVGGIDKVSCFSNTTPVQGEGELIDLYAPGCKITSASIGGANDTVLCGTSMATPYALGVAALLSEYLTDKSISMTPAQLEEHLEATGVLIPDYRLNILAPGYPRVSASRAISALEIEAASGFNITGSTWTDVSTAWTASPDAVQYRVYRSADGGIYTLAGTVSAPQVAFIDTAAACGPLTYHVRVFDGVVESAPSNTAAVTARPCPLAPTNLTLTPLPADTIQLNWLDNATDETHYVVERSVNGGSFEVLGVHLAGVTTANNGPLFCGHYEYRVYTQRGGDVSSFSNTVSSARCAPENDLFVNAEVVPAVIGSDVTDVEPAVRFASQSSDDPRQLCRYGDIRAGYQTVWYEITPAAAVQLTLSTEGTTVGEPDPDTTVSLYTHDGADFYEWNCAEDSQINYLSYITANLDAATTYYVMVSQWAGIFSNDLGSLVVNFSFSAVDSPAHDDFQNARAIDSALYTDTVVNAQTATVRVQDPIHTCMDSSGVSISAGSHNLWYSFTPVVDGQIDVDTNTSSGAYKDTVISVFTGTYGAFTEVACDDEHGAGSRSLIANLPVTGGVAYTIYLSRWSDIPAEKVGTAVLNLKYTPGPLTELLDNGNFELEADQDGTPVSWKLKSALNGDKQLCKATKSVDGVCAFKFVGGAAEKTRLVQVVDLTGLTFGPADTLSFDLWLKASSAGTALTQQVVVSFSDATPKVKLSQPLDLTDGGYEIATLSINGLPSTAVRSIKVLIRNKSAAGKVVVDNVSLQQSVPAGRADTRAAGEMLPPPAAPSGMRGSN